MMNKGDRVADNHNRKFQGTVLTVGPEVSEVKWDGGTTQFVPNNWLVIVPRKKK